MTCRSSTTTRTARNRSLCPVSARSSSLQTYPASTIPAYIPDTVLAPSVGLPTSLFGYLGQAKTNIAPRFGFAYQIRPKTVIRGAVGLYYNLLPSSYVDGGFGNLPFVSSVRYTQRAGRSYHHNGCSLRCDGAFAANPTTISQHSTTTPYTEQYNLAIEHQLQTASTSASAMSASAPFIRTTSAVPAIRHRTSIFRRLRQAWSDRRPFQPFSAISQNFAPIFHTTGNSLQIGVHKQYSNGFMINAEYQWIRVLGVENFENPANIGDSYGNISNLTPQTLEVSYATRCRSVREGALRQLARDRQQDRRWMAVRGHQFFPDRAAVLRDLYGSGNSCWPGKRPGQPGAGCATVSGCQDHREWFNPAAFTAPPNFTYGTSGYNMLWGPHYQNWDMNLMKNISWKERYNLQLRADAFNVFNHPNFGVPSASISNPASMGVVSSTVGEARTLEFAAKFSF